MRITLSLLLAGTLLSACAAPQTTAESETLRISYPDDAAMDCTALKNEIGRMETMIAEAETAKNNAENSERATGAAHDVAVNAALYSGVLGRVPGLGLAANAASGLAQGNAAKEAEKLEEKMRTAELRLTKLDGLYTGKACQTPAE